jgi:outer membrane protein OmpA-like peptidoglycan-associated protein
MTIPGPWRCAASSTILSVVMLASGPALAVASTSPTDTLRGFFGQAVAVIDDAADQTDRARALDRVRELTHTMFDARAVAPLTLGQEWDARSSAERDEFAHLFGRVLEQAYVTWIKALIGGAGIQVSYLHEALDDRLATVKTTIRAKDGRDVPVDYRMALIQGRWTIRDVVVDHISLIQNYRAQFRHLLATTSYSTLIDTLRARANESTATASIAESRSQLPVNGIRFSAGSYAIAPESEVLLDESAEWLRQHPGVDVKVEGHTDEQGEMRQNVTLAERRAEAVKEALVLRGVQRDRLRVTSHAATRPVCIEHDERCWVQNRRVDVYPR